MKKWLAALFKFILKGHLKLIFFIIVLPFLVIVFLAGVVWYSASPSFCKSCHIMKPYYEAWKTSKHNFVSCVECHYPPGQAKTVLYKKFQAISQVAKYVTRTYSSKPYAEIDDSSCLRSNCHSTRLLKGKLVTAKGINFDHRPHLEEKRRGRQLRCVSCHSQVVVGKHVEVTWDTCYLCHFQGREKGRELSPIGGCQSCHKIPEKPFVLQNITYNHLDFVVKRKVACQECHIDVLQGDGEAPQERCFICHNQPEKLAKYEDISFIHANHVTKHNVACFHCHKELRHGFRAAVKGNGVLFQCNFCHIDKHTAQRTIYVGTGGKGIPDMPSPMYLANVDCIACHTTFKSDSHGVYSGGGTIFATEKECLKCHGKKYKGIAAESKSIINETIASVKSKLETAKKYVDGISEGTAKDTMKASLAKVEHNIDFLKVAHGVHNIYYSAQLLRKSDSILEEIKDPLKIELKNLSGNKLLSGEFCFALCHQKVGVKVPSEKVKYKGKEMPHKKHYEEIGLGCVRCHEFGRHKQVGLKTKLPCKDCHG